MSPDSLSGLVRTVSPDFRTDSTPPFRGSPSGVRSGGPRVSTRDADGVTKTASPTPQMFELLVESLADLLVADYRQFPDLTVNSPSGTDRNEAA